MLQGKQTDWLALAYRAGPTPSLLGTDHDCVPAARPQQCSGPTGSTPCGQPPDTQYDGLQ